MSHKVTEEMFRTKLPEDIAGAAINVLRYQYSGEVGYNPGSQMIQIAGISMLNGLDHYIKEQLHIHFYIRYMDDFILIHPDREYLEQCREKIREELKKIRFELNEKKTRIFRITEGILFLGFTFKLTDTGKVVVLVDPKRVKAARKKYKRLVAKSRKGLIPRESVDESYRCWREHVSYGNSYKLLKRMGAYYAGLWRCNNGENQDSNKGRETNRDAGSSAGRGEGTE